MRSHVKQEITTVTRLMIMVRIKGRSLEGALSTQRPKAEEKRRTQRVSAMPLKGRLARSSTGLKGNKVGTCLMEEAVRFPGKAAWMKRIWVLGQFLAREGR